MAAPFVSPLPPPAPVDFRPRFSSTDLSGAGESAKASDALRLAPLLAFFFLLEEAPASGSVGSGGPPILW